MSVLERGMSGEEVARLQERLRELGFDAPGEFGVATEAAVMEFQASRGLMPDGRVGPITRGALEAPAPPAVRGGDDGGGLAVDVTLRLTTDRFVPEIHPKSLIVLHHTAGASARSSFDHWQREPKRIATAYIVERDGTIFEVFGPQHWAFHLGAGRRDLEQRSIGIEMASEGGLTERDGELLAFGRQRFTRPSFDCGEPWRDFRFFAAYTDAQMAATRELTAHLLATFDIPRRTPADRRSFRRDLLDFQGVVGHHHLRADKSDVHPGYDWQALVGRCELVEV